ncbi:MAG: hypothetical protein FJ027_18560 [Candidatus Rokubacteria bacterium]|nr:hypothetical protein [Candidatus Rokubacteria bacterium]
MSNARIFIPSSGPSDWRRLLGDPVRHWVPERSAFECAVAWESARHTARGVPKALANALDSYQSTANAELVIAIPELQVDLPGGGHPSQNDVWALLRAGNEMVSLSVEAKAGEPLDRLVSEWLADASPTSGKPARLAFLRESLGLQSVDVAGLRYQLLHRAVSALVQAERFRATIAILLIHSFGRDADEKSREDYQRFASAMSCAPAFNSVVPVGRQTKIPLLIGWVTDVPASPEAVARAI